MNRFFTALIGAGLLLAPTLPHAADASDVSPEKIEDLKEKIADIDDWLEDAREDRSDLEDQLARAERRISTLKRKRHRLRSKIEDQKTRLDELNQQASTLEQQLDAQRDKLASQIRNAWQNRDAPALKILLNETSPEKLARLMTYHRYLSQHAGTEIERFNDTLADLTQTRRDIESTQADLKKTETQVAARQVEIRDAQKERKQTLSLLESDIDQKQSRREKLVADRKRLEKLLREVQEAVAEIQTPNEAGDFSDRRRQMEWPVKGRVVSGFGESLHDGQLRQNGLMIETAPESTVQAVHYGRVVFSNWLRGFGLMTIIDHGSGYMSLYGNNASLLKSPGDWVRAGDPIAISEQSPEDSRVYFEIRHQGSPVNPTKWLKP